MNMTAVVIDDDPQLGPQIAGILRRLGVKVLEVCETGDEGLKALRRHRPTLATIDNQLPGISGVEIVAKAIAERLPTKLVVCSGTAQKHLKDAALAAGACAFIAKPYDQVLIGRELKTILEG
jgi:CheY-like chemotaxis protein